MADTPRAYQSAPDAASANRLRAALPVMHSSSEMETSVGAVWAPGAMIGNYSLLAKLATGGMAEIWLARQSGIKGFERIVVIKRIIESLSADESFVEMFLDEARIIVQLTHPNIVQVFDLGEHAGAYYIAMEYLAGEHLATIVRTALKAGKPLSLEMAVKLIVSALDGLAHAHTRTGVDGRPLHVVHRDVSPQNIILTWDGQVKLVDFGIARAANRATQTQGNQLKGKYAYMAPEQARGDLELDARADVFATGVVLWELLTHRRLYATDDTVAILRSLIDDTPIATAHEANHKVPKALSAIVAKALEKDPDERWPDAASFKAALEEWLSTRGGGPTTADLGAMMQGLFANRIAERKALIENAARGVATTSQVSETLKPTTNRTMPGQTDLSRRTRWLAIGAVVALLGLAIASGVRSLLEEPETVVHQVEPTRIPASIVVETDPPGAEITLDGRPAGVAPVTLSESKPGEHLIAASLPGRSRVTKTIAVKAEGESLMMMLSLPALPSQEPATAPADAGVTEVVQRDPPIRKAEPAVGKLSLQTEPWTHVSLGGKALGDTPLLQIPLPAGRHQLKLSNDQEKINLTIEVDIKPGQLTKKVLKL
ncbi:MAG: serine/threonine protein kinase [Myxococcaceae bacterium]|nr:serine/threonine protein kinase [Myxococcaceae bacterium]